MLYSWVHIRATAFLCLTNHFKLAVAGPLKIKPTQEIKVSDEVEKQIGGNNSSDVNNNSENNNANAADDDFVSDD